MKLRVMKCFNVMLFFVFFFWVLTSKLSSIPGLEDVTVDRVDQRRPAETNGPAAGSSAPAVSTAPSPPSQVDQTSDSVPT